MDGNNVLYYEKDSYVNFVKIVRRRILLLM